MKIWFVSGVVILLSLGLGITWATGVFQEDPAVTEIKEIQKKLVAPEAKKQLSTQERFELVKEIRKKTEALSEEQKKEVRSELRQARMQFFSKRIEEVLSAPPEKRNEILDRHIDEMEAFRSRFTARREQRDKERRAEETNEASSNLGSGTKSTKSPSGNPSAPANGNSGSATRGGRGGWRNLSPEQRDSRRRERIDSTTPQERAQFTEYIRLLRERREERGLPAFGRPR